MHQLEAASLFPVFEGGIWNSQEDQISCSPRTAIVLLLCSSGTKSWHAREASLVKVSRTHLPVFIYPASTETARRPVSPAELAASARTHMHTHTNKNTQSDARAPYLRNSCRQVSQKRCPQVETCTGSRMALLQSGHWKRRFGFSRNL